MFHSTALKNVSTRLIGLASLALVAATLAPAVTPSVAAIPTAHAAGAHLTYQRGYSVQAGSWLCYGYLSGVYHCTQHWHRSNGQLVSDNPAWVPNASGSATPAQPTSPQGSVRQQVGASAGSVTRGQPCQAAIRWPMTISQWTVPLDCYAGVYSVNPANYVQRPSYGWCNWWPEVLHPEVTGYAALHLPRISGPVPGAVVTFAGGVQGASSEGHYAQVVAVAPGGTWALITEMNFYWRGGGFGKVSYRYIHTGPGVSFGL